MPENLSETFNYDYVNTTARIALYDDLQSTPRVTKIEPARTNDYIGKLAATIHEQSKLMGGKIPYSMILEVAENFIHAQFREIVVSILDGGNTIRFADQGPGIADKEKAQQPGFSSAIEPMKEYIRGVGSGLPIVRDYLDRQEGTIMIEDNLTSGAVVTISLAPERSQAAHQTQQPPFAQQTLGSQTPGGLAPVAQAQPYQLPKIPLSERQEHYLKLLYREGELRVTDFIQMTGDGNSTVSNNLDKLRQSGLVELLPNKRRALTALGQQIAANL